MKKLKWKSFDNLTQLCDFVNGNSYISVETILHGNSYRLVYWEEEV